MASKPYTEESRMPFGQYKGYPLGEIPASYLVYMHDNVLKPGPVKEYIAGRINELREKDKKAEENRAALRAMFK